jgi:hypothetical protein
MATLVFKKKSAPPADDQGASDDGDDSQQNDDNGDSQGADDETAKCPNCGCEFDDEDGKVLKPGKPVEGGSDYQHTDASGKGGPDLSLPQVSPDAQAPMGENAITAALAAVLGGQH